MSADTTASINSNQKNIPFLENGLSEIIDAYDHFILDIFGVIHNGIEPFPNTIETLRTLKNAGKQTCLLSNSPKRAEGAIRQMEQMGISRELFDHVVTSGEATFQALLNRDDDFHRTCGHACWFIGTEWLRETLRGLNLDLVDCPENASFILNAVPGTELSNARALKTQLQVAIELGLPMICSNPDLVVNIGARQFECAGTFAKFYEELGGNVLYHGKPHEPVYQRCYDLLGQPDKSKIIAIGDSLHTDITGANRFGIDSIFNLTGIHWEEVALDHAPGEADLEKIQSLLLSSQTKPTYAMNGFSIK